MNPSLLPWGGGNEGYLICLIETRLGLGPGLADRHHFHYMQLLFLQP